MDIEWSNEYTELLVGCIDRDIYCADHLLVHTAE